MNIFYLEKTIEENAKSHVDKHVIKMRIEYAQMASAAHHMTDSAYEPPYKLTRHKNHRSSVWVRTSQENYLWTVRMGLELCKEMRHRYNTKIQKSEIALQQLLDHPIVVENDPGFTVPVLAIGKKRFWFMKDDDFNKGLIEHEDYEMRMTNVLQNYRGYYLNEKTWLMKWSNREEPQWANDVFETTEISKLRKF